MPDGYPSVFTPVTRFVVCSDTHIRGEGDERLERLKKMADTAYALLGEVDAFLFAGDVTDHGRPEQIEAFWKVWRTSVRKGTETFAVLAKNHDNWEFGREAVKTGLEHFGRITGLPASFAAELGGYPLIGISTSEKTGEYYSEEQRQLLRESLAEARRTHPGKRIFVLQHEHVTNTVFGSFPEDGWGGDWFADILSGFPEAVHFSGHSHYPLNDPRSVYIGAFTAVGTGSMSYAELTVDGVRKIHPQGYEDVAQGWLAEADAENRLRLRGADFLSGEVLCEYFLDGSPLSVPPPPVVTEAPGLLTDGGQPRLRLPRTEPIKNSPVVNYRIRLLDAAGELIEERTCVPPYWRKLTAADLVLPVPPATAKAEVSVYDAFGRVARAETNT